MTYLLTLLLFYADATGKPAYTLISDNWGKTVPVWRNTSEQYGDLNHDGQVNQADLWIYDEVMGEFVGWTVNGDVAHPDDKCYTLQRSTKTKTIKPCKRLCLPCVARKVNE